MKAFFEYCVNNRDLRIERDSEKNIIIRGPVDFYTGSYNSDIIAELGFWNRLSKSGKVFNSSTAFTLPDETVFSPTAFWISNEKISRLSEEDKERFAPVCQTLLLN